MGGGIVAKGARACRIEPETHRRAAVLVKRRLGVGQLVTAHHRFLGDDVINALFIGIGHQPVARPRIGPRIRGAAQDLMEGQLGRRADDRLQLLRRADARHLNQDPIIALPLDRGFARAHLIHPAANDLKALLHGAAVAGQTFGLRQLHDDLQPLNRHVKVRGPCPG